MAGRPDGGQGLQNQGENHQYAQPVMHMILLDQTQSQPMQIVPSTPIQEGYANRLGQARYTDAETDGTQSLMYNNLEVMGIQASPSLQQPSQQVNVSEISQPRASDDISLTSTGNIQSSTGNIQSASGFSDAALLNQPARSHPRPIQSLNTQLEGAAANTERIIENMKHQLGEVMYWKNVSKCVASFQGSRLSQEEISSFAHQLLTYMNDMCIKCFMCKETHDVGTQVRHKENCKVKGCYIETQNNRGNQAQRHVEFNGGRTNEYDQNRDQRLCIFPPRTYRTTEERGPTDLATGGVLQAGVPPSYKAAPIPSSFQTCNESGYTTAHGPPQNQTAQNVHLCPGGSANGRDQNPNQRPCLPPPLTYSTEGNVNVQMKLLSLDRRQGGGLQERGPTDGATGGALHAGALLSEETSNKPNRDTKTLLLTMGFEEDKIHRAQQIFKNRKSNKKWTVEAFLDILDNEIHQENVMDPSICGVCHERKVAASQFECRHVVCRDCAAKRYNDRCKICNTPVVKVVAYDP